MFVGIVEGWGLTEVSKLFCDKKELVSLENQTSGYQWLMNNQKPNSIIKVRGKYYTLSSSAPDDVEIKEAVKKFIKSQETMEYDEFDEWKKTKSTVYELLDDGDFFSCSCPNGLKKYFCKHSIGMAIKFKAYAIPDTAKSVPLATKRRRGRPSKNRGWWSKT